jgi:hypothetical protein
METIKYDQIKQLITLTMITLSGFHCYMGLPSLMQTLLLKLDVKSQNFIKNRPRFAVLIQKVYFFCFSIYEIYFSRAVINPSPKRSLKSTACSKFIVNYSSFVIHLGICIDFGMVHLSVSVSMAILLIPKLPKLWYRLKFRFGSFTYPNLS